MIEYEQYTVGSLIDFLRTQDRSLVIQGISDDSDSYRGYYSEVAIGPGNTTVGELLEELTSKVGTTMYGYKGGEYTYSADSSVFVAYYGHTGDRLVGFRQSVSKDGTYSCLDTIVEKDDW